MEKMVMLTIATKNVFQSIFHYDTSNMKTLVYNVGTVV